MDAYTGETTAQYVFRRLTSEGRLSELLNLPDVFNAELHAWLLRQATSLLLLEYPALSQIYLTLYCSTILLGLVDTPLHTYRSISI